MLEKFVRSLSEKEFSDLLDICARKLISSDRDGYRLLHSLSQKVMSEYVRSFPPLNEHEKDILRGVVKVPGYLHTKIPAIRAYRDRMREEGKSMDLLDAKMMVDNYCTISAL